MYDVPDKIECTHADMCDVFNKALQANNWGEGRIPPEKVKKHPGPNSNSSKRKSGTEEELNFSRSTVHSLRNKSQKTDKGKMPIR